MPSFREAFSGKGLVCCTLTIQYSIYNMVGRSIASLCDFCGIFTSALCTLVYMLPWVVNIGYRSAYCIVCITYGVPV